MLNALVLKFMMKMTIQFFGMITVLSLFHTFIIQYLGVSPCFLSNIWGCICLFIFMDSIVLANDLKLAENKLKEFLIQKTILETFYERDRHEFRERERFYLEKENEMLKKLSTQTANIISEMSSMHGNLFDWSKDVMNMKSKQESESDPSSYSTQKEKSAVMKNANQSHSFSI